MIKGHREAVSYGKLVVGNRELLAELLSEFKLYAVMFFAAFIKVAESVKNLWKYCESSTVKILDLLDS